MFGISPIGWIHTLGSLPAIPIAIYMFVRHGRIVPHSKLGAAYFVFMMVGAGTVFIITKTPDGYVFGVLTIVMVLVGYAIRRVGKLGGAIPYIETITLSISAFLLMAPSVSETLRRVPDGHPIVTDMKSPILAAALGSLLLALIVGVTAQIFWIRRTQKAARTAAQA